jgi:hypothetical protein
MVLWGVIMLDVFLAVGHGLTIGHASDAQGHPLYDPGAVAPDGTQEHVEAYRVAQYALVAMKRSGLSVISETAMGASHDPDYVGSAKRANELDPKVAIEIHFDSFNGVDGFAGQYVSDSGHALSRHIGDAFVKRHLPRKDDVLRTGLYFLNATTMTSLIPEIRRVHKCSEAEVEAEGEALAEGVCAFLGVPFKPPAAPVTPPPHPVPAPSAAVTPASPILAAPRATAAQAEQFLLGQPHGGYSDADVRTLVGLYFSTATPAGLDPLLAVAQMSEETEHLTSSWSQPPHRNLAGIGVTGAPGVGLSFPDLPTAVRAHAGRLLAYAVTAGAATPAQSQLITAALAFRPLPDHLRGTAPTLQGLAGTWAADPQYAAKIAAVAERIRHP